MELGGLDVQTQLSKGREVGGWGYCNIWAIGGVCVVQGTSHVPSCPLLFVSNQGTLQVTITASGAKETMGKWKGSPLFPPFHHPPCSP